MTTTTKNPVLITEKLLLKTPFLSDSESSKQERSHGGFACGGQEEEEQGLAPGKQKTGCRICLVWPVLRWWLVAQIGWLGACWVYRGCCGRWAAVTYSRVIRLGEVNLLSRVVNPGPPDKMRDFVQGMVTRTLATSTTSSGSSFLDPLNPLQYLRPKCFFRSPRSTWDHSGFCTQFKAQSDQAGDLMCMCPVKRLSRHESCWDGAPARKRGSQRRLMEKLSCCSIPCVARQDISH